MIPDPPDDWNADEATAAEQIAALTCTCYDFATMEYDPAGPCPACVADEIAGAA